MKSSLNYLPLAAISDRIAEDDFLTAIAVTSLGNEANVRTIGDWQPPLEGKMANSSRHGLALSWLFQELKLQTFFSELLDSEYFYQHLVQAVGPYHEEDKPRGLLQAVLAAADSLFMTEVLDLFVYGSLMRGESNHYLLKAAEYRGEDAIAEADLFCLGPYPMFVPGTGTVYGECYHIPLKIIPSLDRLEDHPHYYQRRWMQFKSGKTRLVYQGFISHVKGCPQIVSGSWRSRPSIGERPRLS